MNYFRPTFLRLVTTHLLPGPSIPAALWPLGPFVNGGMGQTLALTNCWPGRTFLSAWLHVTSRHPCGCVGSRAGWGLLCTQSQGTPCARVPIVLPCHGHCSAGLDALRRHSRNVSSCGRNILPLIQEKTTLELVKHGSVSSIRLLLLG